MTVFETGQRVRLTCDVDRYPWFIARAGSVGTVTMSTPDEVRVRMDDPLPDAAEWNNEVRWYPINTDDDPNDDLERI